MIGSTPHEIIREIICPLIAKHKGGESYFDALDAIIRNPIYLDLIKNLPMSENVVASGKFGLHVFKHKEYLGIKNLIIMSGGLRNGKKPCVLSTLGNIKPNSAFTFIDDTYYSGTTEKAIGGKLNELGHRLCNTSVIYDGSPKIIPNLNSFFRYHSSANQLA